MLLLIFEPSTFTPNRDIESAAPSSNVSSFITSVSRLSTSHIHSVQNCLIVNTILDNNIMKDVRDDVTVKYPANKCLRDLQLR